MKYKNLHRWDLTAKEAIEVQALIRDRIKLKRFPVNKARRIAGVDVSVKNNVSQAAIVVLSFPELKVIDTFISSAKTVFPYIPGLLSFREAPVILECVKKLKTEPDVFIFDGQGLAHPRLMGLATHLGIILDKPSIGAAKSHLFGDFTPPGPAKGDLAILRDHDGSDIGAVLRTRDNIKPIFVSPGHLMDIPSAVKITLACCPRYKLPEPVRAAHKAASLRS